MRNTNMAEANSSDLPDQVPGRHVEIIQSIVYRRPGLTAQQNDENRRSSFHDVYKSMLSGSSAQFGVVLIVSAVAAAGKGDIPDLVQNGVRVLICLLCQKVL
ncbi:MAG: hypothetical protein KJO35_10150 [Gammaproteobacteria bacterium]|nr:hypothetical protein [Gammaproteobacteria bacterium]